MNAVVSTVPRGRVFIRGLIANTLARDDAQTYAERRWGVAQGERIAKAAVPAMIADPAGTAEARDFFALATEQSLLGRIAGLRRIAFNTRSLRQISGARGYWTGQGKPIPLSRSAMEDFTLAPLKVGAIVVSTKEAISFQGEVNEAAVQRDVLNAVAGALDQAFIDPTNAGTADEVPASVTESQIQLPSTGNAKRDIEAMFAAYGGSFRTAVVVMHPRTAVQIGLLDEQVGETKLTVMGGVLAGVPVVCSEYVPFESAGGTITLLDAGAIAYAARDFDMDMSGETTLVMSDDPESEPTLRVSMFQTNSIAWKAVATANWTVSGSARVVSIVGADYGVA